MKLAVTLRALALVSGISGPLAATPSPPPNRVTILYDAFGGRPGLTRRDPSACVPGEGPLRELLEALWRTAGLRC